MGRRQKSRSYPRGRTCWLRWPETRMGGPMIPEQLKAEYWEQVRGWLERRFRMSPGDAASAVERFRISDDRRKMGEMLYHAEPESTANVVRSWTETQHP